MAWGVTGNIRGPTGPRGTNTVRTVSAATTAIVGELLRCNGAGGGFSVAPPANPSIGDPVTIVKTDTTGNVITFTGTVDGETAGALFVSSWAGATFVWSGSDWTLFSVNVATPAASSTNLTKATADTFYVPLTAEGAANGVATLDASADLLVSQLPPSVITTGQRGPIGGVSTLAYAATLTPDGAFNHYRVAATGALTLNVPGAYVDGQRVLFEVTASGAARVVTMATGYELGGAVTSRTVSIASGLTAYIGVIARAGTWRLLAVDAGS